MNGFFTSISVIFSWGVLLFGILGVIFYRFASVESAVLSVFIIYYVLNLFIIGAEPRLMVPVLPFLGIFTASVFVNGSIDRLQEQGADEEIVTGGGTPNTVELS
jgi:ABC-type siderophore export system fused ATPase/permease subunit